MFLNYLSKFKLQILYEWNILLNKCINSCSIKKYYHFINFFERIILIGLNVENIISQRSQKQNQSFHYKQQKILFFVCGFFKTFINYKEVSAKVYRQTYIAITLIKERHYNILLHFCAFNVCFKIWFQSKRPYLSFLKINYLTSFY